MAYDQSLADRIRHTLAERTKFGEIEMFGGICFTVNGNMAVGVVRDDLMVRVGPDAHDDAMAQPGARLMDFAKRPMKGFLFVSAEGYRTKRSLDAWIDRAMTYVSALPPKKARAGKAATKKAPAAKATSTKARAGKTPATKAGAAKRTRR